MAKKKKGPLIPGFPDKLAKRIPETFITNIESMDEEELKSNVLLCESVIDDTELDMEEDTTLAQAKEDVKLLAGGYRDEINKQKAKVKLILHVMKGRGYNIKGKAKSIVNENDIDKAS